MRKIILSAMFVALSLSAFAETGKLSGGTGNSPDNDTAGAAATSTTDAGIKARRGTNLLKATYATQDADTLSAKVFTPSFQVGTIIHMYGSLSQGKTTAAEDATAGFDNKWRRSFNIYRARILFGAQLSSKGSVFFETDIPTIIGSGPDGEKNVKVSPIILDAQYEHVFSNRFSVIVGKQLVSHNRNGLQGAAALMANDFTHYQYPYNMFEGDPLQGNFGRDLGINTRGFFLKDRLEYRLGAFTGRNFEGEGPVRMVGRVAYNFLNAEKDFYYAGTKLGAGKTFALAGGFDVQGTYQNVGADAFLDVPAGNLGSVTVNAAVTTMTGGTSTGKYAFTTMIPKQTIEFLEVGYYLKNLKLQPWLKFENQSINAAKEQYGLTEVTDEQLDDLNLLSSNRRIGGGINYFFNHYNANLKASYTSVIYGRPDTEGKAERANYGQFWLQLQLFLF